MKKAYFGNIYRFAWIILFVLMSGIFCNFSIDDVSYIVDAAASFRFEGGQSPNFCKGNIDFDDCGLNKKREVITIHKAFFL
jgi:hypothetical protein